MSETEVKTNPQGDPITTVAVPKADRRTDPAWRSQKTAYRHARIYVS